MSQHFIIRDDVTHQQLWVVPKVMPYGLLLHIYPYEPQNDTSEAETIAQVQIDLFDQNLSVLAWNKENYDDDPKRMLLCSAVKNWKALQAGE